MRLWSDFPARECELCLKWMVWICPQSLLLLLSVEPAGPSQLFVCSVTEEVNRFNMGYCAVRQLTLW